MNAPDVWKYIERGYELPSKSQKRFTRAAMTLFQDHKVEISASSAGKCVTEVWAYLHGLYDLPENTQTMLAKMDGGTLYGARIATLFAVGYEDLHPGEVVECEAVVEHEGVPGHIDMALPGWVGEVKTSFWAQDFSGPPEYHVLQAAKYALGRSADTFSIFTLLPGAQRAKGIARPHYVQTDYLTENWVGRVEAEYRRLSEALSDRAPTPDVKEPWRCSSCRYGACPKNTNKILEVPL